ncbi:hypothetical protein [Desulfovibrio ferrophilus]|uniref:Type IV secretion/conjugal transfer ATPase, VirB4 family n=1 Tax=Desulfovibrio ferrophilus TaxID=241368 RepID=A0A2Z6B452_9BACT|nr:hypothetical protein [Desulfovibrio ferrophilus]BBD10158.1 type IV secretion/conjugal transfer ATPase, VirB4 family [Desulfovibrio ferrophilus]
MSIYLSAFYLPLSLLVLGLLAWGLWRYFRSYSPIKPFSRIEEKQPLSYITGDGFTYTKGGQVVRIVEIQGRDYTGLSEEQLTGLFKKRHNWLRSLPASITVLSQSHRHRVSHDLESVKFHNEQAAKINRAWVRNFDECFRTKHYLIFVTDKVDLIGQISDFTDSATETGLSRGQRDALDTAVDRAMTNLTDYRPRILKGDDLMSYWATLMNGELTRKKLYEGSLEDVLAGTTLRWPKGGNHQEYLGSNTRYSAWLVLMVPAMETSADLITRLMQIPFELSVYQTASIFEKQKAESFLKDRYDSARNFINANGTMLDDIEAIEDLLEQGEVALFQHRFAVEVFGSTIDEMENALKEVNTVISLESFQAARETLNQEALHWAKFPETHSFNVRVKPMTSENLSHFNLFPTVGEGSTRCSFGPHPVTTFKTVQGGDYSFIFHRHEGPKATGHTLVVGGTESGKTTLISFLLSQALKYKGMKILSFDRLHGLEVFTSMHDGVYISDSDFNQLQMNPLQVEDRGGAREFLNTWFQMLTNCTDDDNKRAISQAVVQNFDVARAQRRLENLQYAFGTPEPGTIGEALQQWLPSGSYGDLFNGRRDALDFESPIVTFDMTNFLDAQDILGPLTAYIFFKMQQTIDFGEEQNTGFIVFIDELNKYSRNKTFAPYIDYMHSEIRKKGGLVVSAVQSAETIVNNPLWDGTYKDNLETLILFPNPTADPEHYCKKFNLTSSELNFIQNAPPRRVLVKRMSTQESVQLDIDLSSLGKDIYNFNSDRDVVRKLQNMRGTHANWKDDFLSFCAGSGA